jgi:hypothetical protein
MSEQATVDVIAGQKRARDESKQDEEPGEGKKQKALLSEDMEKVRAYVRENEGLIKYADAKRRPEFSKRAEKFVLRQGLTANRLYAIDRDGEWPEVIEAIGRFFATMEETNAMHDLLREFVRSHAHEFPEIPPDLTGAELGELGTNGSQVQVAKALRLQMARRLRDRLKLAQKAEKWILESDASNNLLCVDLIVKQYMSLQASVLGKQMTRNEAVRSFERQVDTAWILRDCTSGLAPVERTDVYCELYDLAERLHVMHEGHFGEIVPEGPYRHKYVRPCGEDATVLVDAKFLDELMERAGMAKRTVLVERCSTGPGDPVWAERKETVHLPEGCAALAELDEILAKKRAEMDAQDSDGPEDRYMPTGPAYPSPSYGPGDACYGCSY